MCFLNEGVNKNSSRYFLFFSVFCSSKKKKRKRQMWVGGGGVLASAVVVSFTAGGLSGAVGCHQANKRHNVMRRHSVVKSILVRKEHLCTAFFVLSINYYVIEFFYVLPLERIVQIKVQN